MTWQQIESAPRDGEIILASDWTLLVVGPHVQRWGFYTRRGWIPVSQYDEGKDC